MKQLERFFLQGLEKSMQFLFAHWFLVALAFFAWQAPLGAVVCLVGYVLVWKKLTWWKQVYAFLMQHKKALLVCSLLFQLLLLMAAKLLIRRDAAVVFTGAFDYLAETSISAYLTRNPNNLFLFLYERIFYHLFGGSGLWVMLLLNMGYVLLGAILLYRIGKKHFGQQVADLSFSFYLLLIGFTPLALTMYTDVLALPLLVLQVGLLLDSYKAKELGIFLKTFFLLACVTGLVYFFRPPALIIVLAGLILFFLRADWKKFALGTLVFAAVFGGVHLLGKNVEKQQTEVQLLEGEGLSKSALAFINLGLTFSGTDQLDMKRGLLQYIDESKRDDYNNGLFAREHVLKEIQRRLKEYTWWTFTQHLFVKETATVADGQLGWTYFEDTKKEKTPYLSPLYERIKDNPLLTVVRQTFISIDTPLYRPLFWLKQVTWIVVAYGLFLASRRYRKQDFGSLFQLAILGGLLFLLIFEGGKSRYLLQFIPQIILLSSLGWTVRKKEKC